MDLYGFDHEYLFNKILNVIDSGITTQELRQNPEKYLLNDKHKKIVYWYGGGSCVLSREIIKSMADMGDELCKEIINNEKKYKWEHICPFLFRRTNCEKDDNGYYYMNIKGERVNLNNDELCIHLGMHEKYLRTNEFLIKIIEEEKINNIGGWALDIALVYDDDKSYSIIKENDGFGSETVYGRVKSL